MSADDIPVVLGYLHAHLLMTENELANVTEDLGRCVEKAGYTLGRVFVEGLGEVAAAFTALMQLVNEQRPPAIVIPSVLHLAPLGLPPQLVHHLEVVMGVRILIANAP